MPTTEPTCPGKVWRVGLTSVTYSLARREDLALIGVAISTMTPYLILIRMTTRVYATRVTRIVLAVKFWQTGLVPEDPASSERLRRLSRAVFGQDHLLSVAVLLLRSPRPLAMAELCTNLGVRSPSSLQASLRRLVDGGFARQVTGSETDRSRPYERCESKFWELVEELYHKASPQDTLFR